MSFDRKDHMHKKIHLKGETVPYLPPEVLETRQGEPTAVDIYCWGISLYQLLNGWTDEELLENIAIRKANYKAFLDNVKKLKVKEDPDGSIGKKAVEILLKVLSLNPRDRPDFKKLVEILSGKEDTKHKLETTEKKLQEVIKERGNLSINSR